MALTNAEHQARWRAKRQAELKQVEDLKRQLAEARKQPALRKNQGDHQEESLRNDDQRTDIEIDAGWLAQGEEKLRKSKAYREIEADKTIGEGKRAFLKKNCDDATWLARHKPTMVKEIIRRFADDGRRWKLHEITQALGLPEKRQEKVFTVLGAMARDTNHGCFLDCVNGAWRFVTASGRKIDMDVLVKQLDPIIRKLKNQGQSHMVRFAPSVVFALAVDIERLIAKLAE